MNSALTLSGWGRRVGKSLMKLQDKTPQIDILRWNIVRGDNVHVIQGPSKGQSGKIIKVLRKSNRVIVEGVNMVSIYFLNCMFCYHMYICIYILICLWL